MDLKLLLVENLIQIIGDIRCQSMPVDGPPGKRMAKKSAASAFGQFLPERLCVRSETIDHCTPGCASPNLSAKCREKFADTPALLGRFGCTGETGWRSCRWAEAPRENTWIIP